MSHDFAISRQAGALAIGICALLAAAGVTSAAEIKVFSDGPLKPALEKVADNFHRDSGHTVQFVFGLSPVIHKKILSGEAGDLVIIQPDFIDGLAKDGKVLAGEHPVVGHVDIGLSARADASPIDISSTTALKSALLKADTIVFNNVASGNYFAQVLERLGIADAVKGKVLRKPPREVDAYVIQSKGNDIGVGVVPIIMTTKGLRLVGALPPEMQRPITYSVALMTGSTQQDAARAFIKYLVTPEAKSDMRAAGVN